MPAGNRPAEANRDQADYWNSASGKKWILFQETLDTVFHAVNDRLLSRADPKPGEKVLDVGCGTGATTRDFAAKVGPGGLAFGIDISQQLLDRAEERRAADQTDHVNYLLADAQTHSFTQNDFDLLTSRFGVMFFADPVAAFANLMSALRPGGRLSFASWSAMAENPWFKIPRNAAVALLGEPPPKPSTAPGPLAFADKDYVLDILRKAGFSDCTAEVEQVTFFFPGGVDEVASLASNIGPAARILKEFDGSPADVAEIGRRVADAFQPYAVDDGVRIPASLNFFDAVRPPESGPIGAKQ